MPTANPRVPVVAVLAVMTGVGFNPTEPVTHTGATEGAATMRPVEPVTVTFEVTVPDTDWGADVQT